MTKKKQSTKKKKVYLYTYTLGDSNEQLQPDKGMIHDWFSDSKKHAKIVMKQAMKDCKWPKGSLIRVTIEKVK